MQLLGPFSVGRSHAPFALPLTYKLIEVKCILHIAYCIWMDKRRCWFENRECLNGSNKSYRHMRCMVRTTRHDKAITRQHEAPGWGSDV